jgi:hypothetical protein
VPEILQLRGPKWGEDRRHRRKDNILDRGRWNLRQRYLTGERGSLDVQDLGTWFEANYPGVEIHPGDWPKTVELIKYAGLGRSKWEWILNGKWGDCSVVTRDVQI